jgi:hypothetical protein
LLFYLVIFLGGCIFIPKGEQLSLLGSFSANRSEAKQYLESQEDAFSRLKQDLSNGVLTLGIPKEEIAVRYSEPIFCRASSGQKGEQYETCLYRQPTRYFTSEKIYLYFDKDKHLSGWCRKGVDGAEKSEKQN